MKRVLELFLPTDLSAYLAELKIIVDDGKIDAWLAGKFVSFFDFYLSDLL